MSVAPRPLLRVLPVIWMMCVVWLLPLFLVLLGPPAGGDPPPPPPPYLRLPVFVDSLQPLVEKRYFSPVRGTGFEPLPERVRDVLLPVQINSTAPPRGAPGDSVSTWCESDKVRVQVERRVLGSDEHPSALTLGSCPVSRATAEHVYFEYDVSMCGITRTMIDDQVVYSNTLRYDPPTRPGPIRRAAPFTVPVACYFNRYQYSYKVGYTPKMQLNKVFKQMKNRVKFILTPRNDQYVLGRPMYFEAEAAPMPPGDRLYVHSCYATPEASHASTPQFPVVTKFGCMTESKDGRSRFIPHKNNVVRFSVDAFLFKGMMGQLYMHCTMSAGSSAPTPTAKSCNYDRNAKRWVELFGPDSVCDCCDSTCSSAASTVPEVISSKPWTIDTKVKARDVLKRKVEFSTAAPPATGPARTPPPPTPPPGDAGLLRENAVKEPNWPFSDGGVMWVEEGEEKVKGSAVLEVEVEEEEEEEEEEMEMEEEEEEEEEEEMETTEPRTVFEDVFDFD